MKKKANRPVAPFYAAAGMWGLYILLFPIRRPVDWLLLALLTGAVFLIARGLCGITRAPEKKQPWLQTTRGGAAVLAAVVLLTGGWTLLRQPAPLPEVSIGNWISDEADLLSEKTESGTEFVSSRPPISVLPYREPVRSAEFRQGFPSPKRG